MSIMDPPDKGHNEGWSSYMRRTGGWEIEPPQTGLGFVLWPLAIGTVLGVLGWTVLVTVRVWVALREPLRWILETSPLSAWVAQQPGDDGQPLQVAVATAALVLVAAISISVWRRSVARRVVLGEAPRRQLLLVSLLRTLVLFGGAGLVLVCAAIATGADLDFLVGVPGAPADRRDVLVIVVALLVPIVVIGGYTWISRGAAWQKAARKLGV